MSVLEEKLFCVMCGKEVPFDRRKKRSITCSDVCAKARTAYLHRRTARTRCRYCMQPCTAEEQARYKRWRQWEKTQAAHFTPETAVEEKPSSDISGLTQGGGQA